MNIYGIIYRIINLINGKIYIGRTRRTIKKRWMEHKKPSATSCFYLSNAIQKYGSDSFLVEEIDRADSEEELNQLEKQWIDFYQSNKKHIGYNIRGGGDYLGISDERRMEYAKFFVKCMETNEIYISVMDAANHKGVQASNIDKCLFRKPHCLSTGGFTWAMIQKDQVDVTQLISCKVKKPRSAETPKRQYSKTLSNHYALSYSQRAKKKVVCVETQESWSSMDEAALSVGASRNWFGVQIRRGKKYKDKTYIFAFKA